MYKHAVVGEAKVMMMNVRSIKKCLAVHYFICTRARDRRSFIALEVETVDNR